MEYTIQIKQFRTPTDANWVTTIPAEYANIKGRIYDIVKASGPKTKDGKVIDDAKDGNGYWSAYAELTGLINPFTNPITNKVVSETKILVSHEDTSVGWPRQTVANNYFEYIASSCVDKIKNRYKDLYGVEIDFTYKTESYIGQDEKKVDDTPATELSLKYISHVDAEGGVAKVTFEVYEKSGTGADEKTTLLGKIDDLLKFEIDPTTKKISVLLSEINNVKVVNSKIGDWLDKNIDKLPKDTKYVLSEYPVEEKKDIKTETKPSDATVVDNKAVSLDGEFTFDVREENLFKGVNNEFKELEIIGIGEIKEEKMRDQGETVDETIDDEIDEEYLEEETTAEAEADIEVRAARTERFEITSAQNSSQTDDTPLIDIKGAAVNNIKQRDAIITVMDILIKEGGFTKEQAAGICGNIKAESGFKFWNVEDGCSNIRPKGYSSKRWDSGGYAYGKNYAKKPGVFSGIGLAQWTYGRRFKMEKYVGKWLKDKGLSAASLKEVTVGNDTYWLFDTDPGLHPGGTDKIYGGAGDNLENYLKTVPNLFEAECSYLQHELKNTYTAVVKMLNGGKATGNTATIINNGHFINKTTNSAGKSVVSSTVAGYAECVVCDFEVPGPVGKAINSKSEEVKKSYHSLVKERVKNAMDCLETYNKR